MAHEEHRKDLFKRLDEIVLLEVVTQAKLDETGLLDVH